MKNLTGKTALITGASSGIGEAFAHELAKQGMNLVLTARSHQKLVSLASYLSKTYAIKTYVVAADLTDPKTPQYIYNFLQTNELGIDLLINNAGFGKWTHFLDENDQTYAQMLELNINAVVKLSHLLLPDMLTKGEGGIINVASTGAFQPCPYIAVYAASKAFVLSFSEALYGEYSKKGITVTALCPGNTETGFQKTANADTRSMASESAEAVAKLGLKAFMDDKNFIVTGVSNYFQSFIPRLLPRKKVINIVEKIMFKRINHL